MGIQQTIFMTKKQIIEWIDAYTGKYSVLIPIKDWDEFKQKRCAKPTSKKQ